MAIVPGFIDSHNHAPGNELLYEVLVGNPYEVEFVTIASILDKLRVKAQQTPADTWVEGYFFDDTKVKDKRALTRQDLDQVSTQLPVMVQHRGGHTAFYNSKALQMAGIKKDTPNPAGGTFDRDANGELTGRVTDRARDVFAAVGKHMTYSGEEAMRRDRDGLAFISKQFVRYGLTSVCHEAGNLQALQQIRARGALLLVSRTSKSCVRWSAVEPSSPPKERANWNRNRQCHDRLPVEKPSAVFWHAPAPPGSAFAPAGRKTSRHRWVMRRRSPISACN
jgi:predicted amidohydrolase YtcJ